MPPPSWAYPYATVWEDFETPGVLGTSTSGGTWVQDSAGDLYGGLTGAGRTGVGAVGPDLTAIRTAEPGILIPGAGSEAVYVKFDVYTSVASSFPSFDAYVSDVNPPRTPGHLFDWDWQSDGTFVIYQDNTSGGTDFDEYDPPTYPTLNLAWHSVEWQLSSDTTVLLVDGVNVANGPLLNPGLSTIYAGFNLFYDPAFGGLIYLDNFEAGPLPLSTFAPHVTDLLSLGDDYLSDVTTATPPTLGGAVLRTPSLSFQSP